MKQTYIMPAMQADEAQASEMLAVSLVISNETVDGSDALTTENKSWDIWDEE